MNKGTTKFTFHNQQDCNVQLVIEPWAIEEQIPSAGIVVFEINENPPPEIEFSITKKGQPYVYVMSERVRIHIEGQTKHDFKTDIRPPMSAFRIISKLWST